VPHAVVFVFAVVAQLSVVPSTPPVITKCGPQGNGNPAVCAGPAINEKCGNRK
jgi:hypothetical protein